MNRHFYHHYFQATTSPATNGNLPLAELLPPAALVHNHIFNVPSLHWHTAHDLLIARASMSKLITRCCASDSRTQESAALSAFSANRRLQQHNIPNEER